MGRTLTVGLPADTEVATTAAPAAEGAIMEPPAPAGTATPEVVEVAFMPRKESLRALEAAAIMEVEVVTVAVKGIIREAALLGAELAEAPTALQVM